MANEFKVRKGLVVNGSGSVILDVQGSQGQLFSVTDQLSGSLFSVNDISGVPVLEAFSDSTVKIGQYLSEAIVVSGSTARITGSIAMAGFSSGSVLFAGPGGSISQNNSGLFWDNANGRLGIGTNSPDNDLEIQKNRNATTNIAVLNTTAGTTSVVEFKAQTDGGRIFTFGKYSSGTTTYKTINGRDGYIFNSSQGGDIALHNDNTTGNIKFNAGGVSTAQMTLHNTGNLLLGSTTNSGERLQVSGSAKITDGLVVTGSTTIVGNVSTGATLTIGSATGNAGSLKFFNGNVGIDRSGASGLLFRVGSNNIAATITSDRLVGIGTESPTTLLHISGSTGGLFEIDSNTLANILYVSSSGHIGIGTNTPAVNKFLDILFNVPLTGGSGFRVRNTSSTGYSELIFDNDTTPTAFGAFVFGYGGTSAAAGSNIAYFFQRRNAPMLFGTNDTERMRVFGGGNVAINSTSDSGERLQVSGSSRFVGNMTITGSANITQALTASAAIISGSGTQRLTVVGSGSAQPLFTVQGSQGELFSIVDSLSGSLFSVNDQSGLPIMEVFSDNTILMGNYLDPMLLTTTRTGSAAGINTLYTLPTSSYDAVYIDYTIRSGSNARAGNFMAMWSGTSVNFTDNSITEFGTTSGFVFGAHVSGSNMVVTGSSSTSGWTVKTIIKAL
jgi:hypothetical protein